MRPYVVDASVAAKWLFAEAHHEAARRLRRPGLDLHAPDFALLELANLYGKKHRRGELTRDQATRALALTRAFPLQLHAWADLLDPAFALSLETGRSFYDCLYLALAVALDGVLVTADRKLYDALAAGPQTSPRGPSVGGSHASCLLWVEAIPA